jgi:hypothetical protein
MPPKSGPSKKTVDKAKNKIVEDKTFGLKNKNKSKTVQKYVQNVTNNVKGGSANQEAANRKKVIQDDQTTGLPSEQSCRQKRRPSWREKLLRGIFSSPSSRRRHLLESIPNRSSVNSSRRASVVKVPSASSHTTWLKRECQRR